MGIVYILLPASLFLALIAFLGFFWAVGEDQFEELDSVDTIILFDEDDKKK